MQHPPGLWRHLRVEPNKKHRNGGQNTIGECTEMSTKERESRRALRTCLAARAPIADVGLGARAARRLSDAALGAALGVALGVVAVDAVALGIAVAASIPRPYAAAGAAALPTDQPVNELQFLLYLYP